MTLLSTLCCLSTVFFTSQFLHQSFLRPQLPLFWMVLGMTLSGKDFWLQWTKILVHCCMQALPISSVGLRMDDSTLRIAVGLCLGTTICAPHKCHRCGAEVSACGTHGISCKSSVGRHSRHAAITTSSIAPSPQLEFYVGWSHQDCPDQMTRGQMACPLCHGVWAVWDATCPDTFATSYRGLATSGAGYAMAVRQHEWKHCMCTSNKKDS